MTTCVAVTRRLMRRLAGLGFVAGLLALLLVVLILDATGVLAGNVPRTCLLFALATALVAGIIVRRRAFRRKPALLLFHLCLLAIVSLAAIGYLCSFRTGLLGVEGLRTRVRGASASRGPWAPDWLDGMAVMPEYFKTRYWRGDTTADTRAGLALHLYEREVFRGEVVPNRPAAYRGARVYLTTTQGFAAIFTYRNGSGTSSRGFVAFPEYRSHPDGQEEVMNVPGRSGPLQCRLDMPSLRRDNETWELAVPASARVIVSGSGPDSPRSLGAGESMVLDKGRLQLDAIRPWGKLVVNYDPLTSWVLGLALAASVALFWHYGCLWWRS